MIMMNDTLDVVQIFEGDKIAVLEQLDCKNKEEIKLLEETKYIKLIQFIL